MYFNILKIHVIGGSEIVKSIFPFHVVGIPAEYQLIGCSSQIREGLKGILVGSFLSDSQNVGILEAVEAGPVKPHLFIALLEIRVKNIGIVLLFLL